MIEGFNASDDDTSISCKPNLMLLHAPVIDNGENGYGYDRVKDFWEDFSPVHNLNNELPPTCILLGNKDPLIPFESAVKVGQAVKKSGSSLQFYIFEGKGHGLFSQKESELSEPIRVCLEDDYVASLLSRIEIKAKETKATEEVIVFS